MKRNFDPQWFWDNAKTEESPLWPAICIDFNGVIDTFAGWNGSVEDYPPAPNAEWFLEYVRKQFATVIILTATRPYTLVEDWFIKYELDHLIDYVTNVKVPAVCYVDDRAVLHDGDFYHTLVDIERFKPHWEK